MSNINYLLNNITVTSSDTTLFIADGDQAVLFWSIQGPITGTSPTIQFFASEVEPSNASNIVGITASSPVITGTAVDQLQFSFRHTPAILISWVVSGASASFGTVTLSIASGNTGVMTISGGTTAVTLPSSNTTTTVASSTSNTLLLTSNSSRLGATLFNDSSSMLYVKLGSAATLTDFTVKVFPQSYYEIPFGFTGNINGFWISANGSARIGELH